MGTAERTLKLVFRKFVFSLLIRVNLGLGLCGIKLRDRRNSISQMRFFNNKLKCGVDE